MLCTSCFCSSKSLSTATLFMRWYKLVSNHNLATLTSPYFVSSPCVRRCTVIQDISKSGRQFACTCSFARLFTLNLNLCVFCSVFDDFTRRCDASLSPPHPTLPAASSLPAEISLFYFPHLIHFAPWLSNGPLSFAK